MTAFAVFQPFSSRFTLGMCIVPGFSCFVFAFVSLFGQLVCDCVCGMLVFVGFLGFFEGVFDCLVRVCEFLDCCV